MTLNMTFNSIATQFEQQLTTLGSGGPATVTIDAQPRKLSCDILERDALAVSFETLRITTPELASSTGAELERIGKSLAERLTYLMEPISPIELDAAACVVQLRSNPPHKDDDGRTYYELMIRRGGEIGLARYRKENGNARRPIPATVTREVLLRLTGDFCAVLD